MIYQKPKDITYTQMCIWIDKNAYTVGFDEEKMYKYIYLVVDMLTKKGKLFSNSEDYENFALYTTSRLYLRLTNKKQFEYDANGSPKLPRIKSILNYAKKTLHLCKIDYLRDNSLIDGEEQTYSVADMEFGEYVCDIADLTDQMALSITLGSIDEIVRVHLSKIPMKRGSVEWHNIYMSCMLTLISMFSPKASCDLDNAEVGVVAMAYARASKNPPILFHLDKNMENYIRVLVNEIKHCIAEELSWRSDTRVSADSFVKRVKSFNSDCEE